MRSTLLARCTCLLLAPLAALSDTQVKQLARLLGAVSPPR